MRTAWLPLFSLALGLVAWLSPPAPRPAKVPVAPPVATFSIVGFDPETGDLGIAVQSKFFGVGAVVPWARADVGAVATQSYANTVYGPAGLDQLDAGAGPADVMRALTAADPRRDLRQLGLVDARGRAAAYTGTRCQSWAGHQTGPGYACQGNILAGPAVVKDMAKAFEQTQGPLAERLMAALAAGQAAGGDRRGRQSAALLVVRRGGGYAAGNDRYIDLHVEDHPTPIVELSRLLALWRKTMPPADVPPKLPEHEREPPSYGPEALKSPRGAWTLRTRARRAVYLGTRWVKPGAVAEILSAEPGSPRILRTRMVRGADGRWSSAPK